MENLTKQQLVLLALLVSFVSSIATGIVTVSLLDQASPAVTQTINRIVERTVETVVPASTGEKSTIKETIIVSEGDARVSAIEKAVKSIVRVKEGDNFSGFGIILTDAGRIVAKTVHDPNLNYRAVMPDSSEVSLDFVSTNNDFGITVFQINKSNNEALKGITKGTLVDAALLKIGQTAIAIGGQSLNSVEDGIISSVIKNEDGVSSVVAGISGSLYAANSVLINLSGEIIGLKKGSTIEEGYISSNVIKNIIN